jgi:hypothetical protein
MASFDAERFLWFAWKSAVLSTFIVGLLVRSATKTPDSISAAC